jgi:steroid delta-isomerase-like uncharacterized protein
LSILVGKQSILGRPSGGGIENVKARADVVQEWVAAWSTQNVERVLSVYTEDCIYEDVAFAVLRHGNEELREFVSRYFGAFPDFKIDLTNHFVANNWAVAELTASGTHDGELPDLPASGKRFSLRCATILVLNGGKIARSANYCDRAAFLEQIGALGNSGTPLT